VHFVVLVPMRDGKYKYTPLYWEGDKLVAYNEQEYDESFVGDIAHHFHLMSFEKPYPLAYYLAGIKLWGPFSRWKTDKRYIGMGMSGLITTAHDVVRGILNPKGDNCVTLLLSEVVQDSFDTIYGDNKNLKDYKYTQTLLELLRRVDNEWKRALLVVINE